jgi:hypothetical protein
LTNFKYLKKIGGGGGQVWWLLIIPGTWEVEIKRITVQVHHKQKVKETLPQSVKKQKQNKTKKLDVVVHVYHPSSLGSINRGTVVQASLGINSEILFEK